jgi:hypothetical protein
VLARRTVACDEEAVKSRASAMTSRDGDVTSRDWWGGNVECSENVWWSGAGLLDIVKIGRTIFFSVSCHHCLLLWEGFEHEEVGLNNKWPNFEDKHILTRNATQNTLCFSFETNVAYIVHIKFTFNLFAILNKLEEVLVELFCIRHQISILVLTKNDHIFNASFNPKC